MTLRAGIPKTIKILLCATAHRRATKARASYKVRVQGSETNTMPKDPAAARDDRGHLMLRCRSAATVNTHLHKGLAAMKRAGDIVLITGSDGRIGTAVTSRLKQRFDNVGKAHFLYLDTVTFRPCSAR